VRSEIRDPKPVRIFAPGPTQSGVCRNEGFNEVGGASNDPPKKGCWGPNKKMGEAEILN